MTINSPTSLRSIFCVFLYFTDERNDTVRREQKAESAAVATQKLIFLQATYLSCSKVSGRPFKTNMAMKLALIKQW
jgi:hypothetical protein